MAIDPRKGKATVASKRVIRSEDSRTSRISLSLAFDMYYNAKRTEGLRERTLTDCKNYWRYFLEWLEQDRPEVVEVDQITTEVVRSYVGYMMHDHTRYGTVESRKKDLRKLSPATISSRLRAVQSMCKFWESEGLLLSDPAAKIKRPRMDMKEKPIMTEKELSELLSAPDIDTYAGYRDYVLILLLADTGLRINEALSLRELHIDVSARCIRLPAELNKNRKPRIIPLSVAVLRELIKLMEETRSYFDTDHCFVANYGEPLKADHFRKRLLQHAGNAGIDVKKTPVTPHRLRDYFCTQYLLNGGDLFTLQRIVAHADIKTTQGYVKPSEIAIRNSHEQFSPLSRIRKSRK